MSVLLFVLLLCGCGGDDPVAPDPPKVLPPTAVEPGERPNVLIVLWDTVRADRMSMYGHTVSTTPRMDEWAKGATVFEEAWSPATWTLPAHAAMFTGLHTTTHGAHAGHRWLDGHHDTVAEQLGKDGYDTFAISSNLFASPMSNLHQGFDTFASSYPRGKKLGRLQKASKQATMAKILPDDASTEISPKFSGSKAEKWAKSVYKDAAPVMTDALIRWIDSRSDSEAPWFAYINMMEAHTPRIPSKESREAVMSPEVAAHALAVDASLFAENSYIVGKREYSAKDLEAIRGVYDAAIRDLDTATADLMDTLQRRGELDDTVVILVADHGESLGEHRMMEHRWSIHEPLLRVPLVVRYPHKLPPGRVETPVSTIDVYATVLDLARSTQGGAQPTSRSLRLMADRGPIHAELVDPYASQMRPIRSAYPDVDLTPWKRTYASIRDGDLKYVRASDGEHELYDLQADPAELENLMKKRAADAERLHQALHAWEAALPTYDASKAGPDDKGGEQMSDEEREQLIAMGYMDPDEGLDSDEGSENEDGQEEP